MWPFRTYVGLIEAVQALTVEAVFFQLGPSLDFSPKKRSKFDQFWCFCIEYKENSCTNGYLKTGSGPPIVH